MRGDSAEAPLTITEGTGDGDGGEPSITVDFGSAAPGDDVTIGGDNFGPDETIAVEVTDKDGNGIDTSLLRYPVVVLGEPYKNLAILVGPGLSEIWTSGRRTPGSANFQWLKRCVQYRFLE